MNIPAKIYENLSPAERIRAAVSALARNDDAEIQTLKVTCPKQAYLMTDPAFSEGMERLMTLAIVVEYDLMALALDYFLASRQKSFDAADKAISDAVSLEIAWRESLAEIGIPWQDMLDADPPRHRAVKAILHVGEGEETAEEVRTFLDLLRAKLPT